MTSDVLNSRPPVLDLSGSRRTPFARLVAVELRKTVDTRSGFWLVLSMGLLTAAVMAIMLFVMVREDISPVLWNYLGGLQFTIGVLLPVLAILLVTSEWSQRTGMVTFALEPSRGRVVAAKFVTVVLISVVASLVALAIGFALTALHGAVTGQSPLWDAEPARLGGLMLSQALGTITGFALGVLFLNSAVGIVMYFVYSFILPSILALGTLVSGLDDILPWVNFWGAQALLTTGEMTGEQWAQLGVSTLIWVGIPLILGLTRILRAEVK